MAHRVRPIAEGEGGPYAGLAGRPRPGGLVLVFIPSLAALLGRAEELAGSPLRADQVARIRDAALVVATRPEAAAAVEERRGYADVDPARPWESWQAVRGVSG